jgi:type II secretory pathway pseudopilin PulG
MNLKRLWASRQGYTIDQTILIVAIIAILITLIIITIGWTLLTRTTGNKLASYMTQMDTAINSFYNDNRRFPATGDGIAAFQTAGLTKFRRVGTTGQDFRHEIGGPNGTVRLINPATSLAWIPGGGVDVGLPHIVIEFTLVPLSEANQADISMDGVASNVAGRVYTTGADTCENGTAMRAAAAPAAGATTVTVCYVAQRVS